MFQVAAAILSEQNVKMMQNVIRVLELEGNVDNATTQKGTLRATLRALSLVFSQVNPPPDLEPKLTALLKKLNPMPGLKDSE